MDKSKAISAKMRLKDLIMKKTYAEYKMRYTDDLDVELDNWVSNIMGFITPKKGKK